MGLSATISRLLGRKSRVDSAWEADLARTRELHGQRMAESAVDQGETRRRMEAEVDAQNAARANKAASQP